MIPAKGDDHLRFLAKVLLIAAIIVLFFDATIIHDLTRTFDRLIVEQNFSGEEQEIPSIPLTEPEKEPFAIATIEPGMTKFTVEEKFGPAQRITFNEYDTYWYAYHENYQNFFLVTYDKKDRVAGLYTNQDLLSSIYGIELGTQRDVLRKQLGTPLEGLEKGLYFYYLPEDRNYDLYLIEGNYVTFFYDEQDHGTVRAVQIIAENLENTRVDMYSEPSVERMIGFEEQLFDLTNAERKKFGLPLLKPADDVKQTAREHSQDMAINHYFSHTNLQGQSPFDRMDEDQITYRTAGENLAYGQWSAIFAHEGLMSSPGHRENILHRDFEYLGIGVAFNDQNEPFFTQLFYGH